MGENDGWCQPPPVGLLPNGLLPGKAASVVRVLDAERWVKAEERAAELIACIQPSPSSEERRNAVAKYVQRLIMECFPCQVFTFGSVPLKTYLPDGDIDLTAFSENNNLKDTWAHLVRDVLEKEENNANAEFRVKEVQYIQAEVKLIKCLVENIVVDISFDQVGGLCTLCFLEEVDNLVKQNHLFKRSIILIKAWCYYESRILGAHHGLISTYALETLVLYIFHVYNNSFAGPLEVLYRFLAFFSNFDWENFCVSLWGPVPISSLPVGKAEPPRKDDGDLLLSKMFLKACGSAYAVFPAGQENQAQPFVAKHFNVIDPLRLNNNLGRSVSKGNFFRIRSAFSFGAKRLARLLDCPKEEIYYELNQFFTNTWYRHGRGDRPDAAGNDLGRLRLSNSGPAHVSEDVQRSSSSIGNENHFVHNTRVDVHSQHNNSSSESTCKGIEKGNDISMVSKSHKTSSNVNSARASEQSRNRSALNGKGQKSFKPEPVINNYQGRHLFARTRSSPELTEVYGEVPSQSRDKRLSESGKSQTDSARLDGSRRKNRESEDLTSRNIKPVAESLSVRLTSSHQTLDSAADTNSAVNKDLDDLGSGSIIEEFPVANAQGMEEHDSVSATRGLNGQFHVPVNFASGHYPFPIPPSILTSMGYTQRNMGGVIPTHIPMIHAPWGTHMQIPQGLVSSPFAHYLPGGFPSNLEKVSDSDIDNFGLSEINPETGHDFWHEQARVSADFDTENGGCEMHQTGDTLRPSSGDAFVSSRFGDSKTLQKVRESGSTREEIKDSSQFQVKGDNQTFFDDRNTSSRSVSVSRASSVRSKTSSESSWDGTMPKVSKPARERQNKRAGSSGMPYALSITGKSVSELSAEADENTSEWSPTLGSEVGERDASPQPTESLIVSRHQMHGFEPTQTSGSDSVVQMAPFLLGHGSQQRPIDNSGGGPFAFYATGPPVPFVAMIPPFYNFMADTGTPDASNSHFSRDESLENIDSNKNVDVSADLSEVLASSHSASRDTVEPLEHKPDILNSDFASHVQNLQYGRFCQNSRFPAPLVYPSPGVVPPAYLQNTFPWDGLERRLASDSNVFNQLASYGQPHLVTVAPPQSVSTSSAKVYPHYTDEMPRHRSGTGTYFPNPLPARDRQSTSVRRGNYNHDRYDHHSDRDGNWNISPKPRMSGRSHTRNQAEKSNSRKERTDRHWGSYRHEPSHLSYNSQNGPSRPNTSRGGSANMAYGVYRPPAMRHSSGTSGGSGVPSVMLYAYDHNVGHGSSAEQLEFGSLGPIGFRPANEDAHMNEVNTISTGAFEEPRFHCSTARLSSPDQPSSPHHSREV